MEIKEAIYGRRSIRRYSQEPVPKDILLEIIQAGTWAPSACNIQGWKFIIIDEKGKFASMVKNGAASFLKDVNQAILVLYDNRTDNLEYQDYIQSASACVQNMLLMAYSLNVGACWVNFLPTKKVLRRIFSIPDTYSPIALVTVGYYEKTPAIQKRKQDLREQVFYNTCTLPTERNGSGKLAVKRVLRRLYFWFPLKALLTPFLDKHEKKFEN